MTILLHNLLARAPRLSDVDAVTKLLIACDIAEAAVSHSTEEDVLCDWQQPGFDLASDARVIITNKGQLVGYASIHDSQHVHIDMQVSVHPSYRGRGIGTLLLRLAEARARQHIKYAQPGARISVTSAVSSINQAAKDLLEHEGYSLVSHFWRIVIDMDEAPHQSLDASQRDSKLKLVLDVSHPCFTGTTRIYEPSGWYVVRQYDVYEKELRAGEELNTGEVLGTQLVQCK